jgi:DNA-binding XRE family transcriptional regulator
MESIKKTPPTALRLERIKQGVQPWRLANQIGISLSLYYLIEQGRKRADYDMQRRIAKMLECRAEDLFPEENKSFCN